MSVVVMRRWVPMTAREQPVIGQRAHVSDGIEVLAGRYGLDRQWYLDAPGPPRLLENYLFGPPDSWSWMKLPAPPGRA